MNRPAAVDRDARLAARVERATRSLNAALQKAYDAGLRVDVYAQHPHRLLSLMQVRTQVYRPLGNGHEKPAS